MNEIDIKSNAEEFEIRWQNKCEEIKKQSFDKDACYHIIMSFHSELAWYTTFVKKMTIYEMSRITNDVRLAIEIAHSNYQKQKKSLWGFLKNIKQINLIKNF